MLRMLTPAAILEIDCRCFIAMSKLLRMIRPKESLVKSALWGMIALVAVDITVVLLVPCEDLLLAQTTAKPRSDVIAILFHDFSIEYV
ncbi:MAG: hypothetical protein ABFS02_08390, partial [Pseudomonadota bacterium]